MDKLRFKFPTIAISTAIFGFIGFVGYEIAHGQEVGAARGIVATAANMLNGLSSALGPEVTGYGVMGLAAAAAIGVAIWIWRDPLL